MTRAFHLLLPVFCLTLSHAYAAPLLYTAFLDGASQATPNASPGTGTVEVFYDADAHTLRVNTTFSDLVAGTTAAHIHAPTSDPGTGSAPVATAVPSFPGFPLGVTGGAYDQTFDLTLAGSWNPNFVSEHGGTLAAAETFLASSLDAGTAYFNIHTQVFPGGEIRGFLAQPASGVVPEPATAILLGTGLAGLACAARRRARRTVRSGSPPQ